MQRNPRLGSLQPNPRLSHSSPSQPRSMVLYRVFSPEGGEITLASHLSPTLVSPTGNPVGSAFKHTPVRTASHHLHLQPLVHASWLGVVKASTLSLCFSTHFSAACVPDGTRVTDTLESSPEARSCHRSPRRCLTMSIHNTATSKVLQSFPTAIPCTSTPRVLAPHQLLLSWSLCSGHPGHLLLLPPSKHILVWGSLRVPLLFP